jgi:hypothetical protein
MNREIMLKWINIALEIEPGESIFLATENREHSKALVRSFKNELKILAEVDPVKANKISVNAAVKDGRYWTEIKKTFGSPLVGFKRGADGLTHRISIEDPERRRRLSLMQEDGMTLAEVEKLEDDLTAEEKEMFI